MPIVLDGTTGITSPDVDSKVNGLNYPDASSMGFRNRIINGNFGINQRGVSGTVTLAAGVYGHDRWKAGASGCTYTFATTNNVTTLTISAGSLIQVIEGLNLYSGTYTLSWTGTAQGKIGAGSYAGSGVTGSATGGTNLNIEFNTGTLSFVQFEQGSVATPFERRPYGTELALCQRYYEKSYPQGTVPGSASTSGYSSMNNSNAATNVYIYNTDTFVVAKRTAATMRVWDLAGNQGRITTFTLGGLTRQDNNNSIFNYAGSEANAVMINNQSASVAGTYQWDASAEI